MQRTIDIDGERTMFRTSSNHRYVMFRQWAAGWKPEYRTDDANRMVTRLKNTWTNDRWVMNTSDGTLVRGDIFVAKWTAAYR